jgi:hypothetical protein
LGDHARTPEFIQTVHWRGYRFIGTLSEAGRSAPLGSIPPIATPSWVVGREKAFGELGCSLAQALAGERQVVFVTGEPGIGRHS